MRQNTNAPTRFNLSKLRSCTIFVSYQVNLSILNQRGDDVYDKKIPGFRFLVINPANLEVLKNLKGLLLTHCLTPLDEPWIQ